MRELEVYTPDNLSESEKSESMLLVCDESSITCSTFRQLQEAVVRTGLGAVIVIPDYQYQKGFRGWAKVQMLASVIGELKGVMPLDYEAASQELKNSWGVIKIFGSTAWNKSKVINPPEIQLDQSVVVETTDKFDKEMMDKAKSVIKSSNCWLDPAGCVFVRNGKILVESTSSSFNHSNCRAIPINLKDLPLNQGERMLFCDSLHAERVGISQAAKEGISLEGATMYVTKFPCRPCALSTIAAGVSTIVFNQGSYGLVEAADLFASHKTTLKKITT